MEERKVFNEHGSDEISERKLIGGNQTGIANLNSIKFKWASSLYTIMLNNHWIPQKVSLVEDRVTMKELTEQELSALKNTLSFLIALDSMQCANLPRMSAYITAPEVSAIYTLQEFQEMIHSQSYQYILQELFPSVERDEIYNYWRTNPLLLKRNKSIAEKYQKFIDNPNDENFKLAIAADFALEGIYFYSGFNFFYQVASRNKIPDTSKIIKYIENDEVTHVSFMNYQIKELFDVTNPADKAIIVNTLTQAALEEIEWGYEVYGDHILGISKQSTEAHVKWLANQRSKLVGCGVIFKGFNNNPYAYLDGEKKENYFETTVVEYSQSTAVDGWDEF
jgi:ribonucleoside-diphosphate reductase beta chain